MRSRYNSANTVQGSLLHVNMTDEEFKLQVIEEIHGMWTLIQTMSEKLEELTEYGYQPTHRSDNDNLSR